MNEQDKVFARRMLELKRLSIDQVERIRLESERTKRPFRDIADALGLLPAPAPRKMPPLYLGLLAGSLLIFAGLLIATLSRMGDKSRRDDELALETERARAEADRHAVEASRGYKKAVLSSKESAAREQLEKARASMIKAEALTRSGGAPTELALALNDAFVGYNMYLKELPDDAVVLVERARTHELRRNYDLAINDLTRAIQLQPSSEVVLKDKIAQLRLFIARKPQ